MPHEVLLPGSDDFVLLAPLAERAPSPSTTVSIYLSGVCIVYIQQASTTVHCNHCGDPVPRIPEAWTARNPRLGETLPICHKATERMLIPCRRPSGGVKPGQDINTDTPSALSMIVTDFGGSALVLLHLFALVARHGVVSAKSLLSL